MNERILLNKNKSKVSTNVNNSLTVQFKGSKRILPCDPMETSVNEIDVYNDERENCSKIRLTVQINPICSNVLFNNLTEVVRNEGTDYAQCLNFIELKDFFTKDDIGEKYGWDDSKLKCKNKNNFETSGTSAVNAVRDTQLSNEANGFIYHCGIDIFNNHYLRSKTFKTVCPREKNDIIFNTIFDEMRRYDNLEMEGYLDKGTMSKDKGLKNMHLYLNDELTNYKETVSEKLIESNGWFGFTNVGKMKVYNDSNTSIYNNDYDWFKVINNRKPCDFIDMYPERELFFFDPKYNSFRRRIEKNWLYCITYPSSSTTDVPFIREFDNNTTGLKAMYFDDTIKHKNGTDAIKIWSVSQHGLSKGDIINLYKSEEKILQNARVIEVVDEYTFYVYRNGVKISKKWLELPEMVGDTVDLYDEDKVKVATFNVSSDRTYVYGANNGYEGTFYLINNKKANIDSEAQDISFKRVVEENEVSYYVRIFSKLPNWKFKRREPTEYLLEKFPNIMKEYQETKNDFDSHIGRLAFSKNIYNDNIAQIVFTDDIDIKVLKDNLNRPLSELYLTIIKNNAGYREWYGKDKNIDTQNEIVEYSHCFGKVNCAFKLSRESIPNKDYNNVLMINNIDNTYSRNGLDMTYINDGDRGDVEDDEIQYEPYGNYSGDCNFYGDLCCYSTVLQDEQSIQMVDFRFNTAQRELTNAYKAMDYFGAITYDEIISDDYDDNGFKVKTYTIPHAVNRREGYYYQPHYKIPIKSFDNTLTTVYPRFLSVRQLSVSTSGDYNIVTLENHLLGKNSIINIYDKVNKVYLFASVTDIVNGKSVSFKIYDDVLMENLTNIDASNKNNFKFFIKSEEIPSYATLMDDGSCRYVYRELHQNGFDDSADIETYPFTNGSLYINKTLNFFLRRQNYDGTTDLRSKTYPYDIVTNSISYEKENNYYHEEEIEC